MHVQAIVDNVASGPSRTSGISGMISRALHEFESSKRGKAEEIKKDFEVNI